jgi:hypothetical protein
VYIYPFRIIKEHKTGRPQQNKIQITPKSHQ